MSVFELIISQQSQIIEHTAKPCCLPEKLISKQSMHAKQHDTFFRHNCELNSSPSGSHALRALASVLAHRATTAGFSRVC